MDAQGEVDAALTGSALGSAEALMALAAGNQAEEEALEQEEESDADLEPKGGANGNGAWQVAARALDEDDEDDAVNSPQDKCTRVSDCPTPCFSMFKHCSIWCQAGSWSSYVRPLQRLQLEEPLLSNFR